MLAIGNRRRNGRWWAVARAVAGTALGLIGLWALNGRRDELVGASSALSHLHTEWLLLAVAVELCSFVAFGVLQQRLLGAGGVRIGLGDSTAICLASGAIADSLPAGPAFAAVYAFRLYLRRGADDVLAGWTLVATLAAAAATLAVVALVGVGLAAHESASDDLVGVVCGVVVAFGIAVYLVLQRRILIRVAVLTLVAARAVFHRPRREALAVVEDVLARLSVVRLRRRDLAAALAGALFTWLFDCGALTFSFLAISAPVPWRALLLAYGAAQLAVNLPITPGGLGVVEGTLTIGLVAFGGAELSTVTAVLCYRIVSFWGYLPVGWLTWAGLELQHRRAARAGRTAPRARWLGEHAIDGSLATPVSSETTGVPT